MSGFRFPMHELSPPPFTPLQELTNKENQVDSPTMFSMASGVEPTTPEVFKRPLKVVQPEADEVADELPTMESLVTWVNPPASLCALLTGEAMLLCAHYMFTLGNASFLSGTCNLLLISLGLNFMRALFSQQWLRAARWVGSEFEALLVHRVQHAVKFAMLLRDETICADSPVTMLKTGTALVTLSFVGFYISFWRIMTLAWLAAFTVPLLNRYLGPQMRWLSSKTLGLAQAAGKKLTLSRTAKLAGGAGIAAVTMAAASWGTRSALALLFLILVRCTLEKDEVTYLRNHKVTVSMLASPLLRSAFTGATTVSHTMSGIADNVLLSAMRSATKRVVAEDSPSRLHTN